jgi:NADP-dependent 3-hydroxy acid dehydrogenase YdfG
LQNEQATAPEYDNDRNEPKHREGLIFMAENIENKVVVITGASSGLGAEAARHLVKAGAKVVLGARRLDRLQALAAELGLGDDAVVQTDVKSREQVKALVDHAVATHGRIDVMINNAGLMPLSPLELERFEEWNQAIDVNIKGVLWGIAAALPYFKQQHSGHFINVSSVAGHSIRPGGAIYSATKYSVRVISEALRQEVKPYNIRTTVISPGAVDTELPSSVKAEGDAKRIADFYKQTAIPADSFARCVLFAVEQPEDVDINEIVYRPTRQA